MEESKELQGFYKIFRGVIYVSILLEFFEYAIDPFKDVSSVGSYTMMEIWHIVN